jgi:hypothetical protein
VTDGQGHFSLGGFHVGERIQLSANGGDVTWAVAPATDALIKAPAAHVDSASLIVVDGRVVNADGAPMASASIWGCKWDDQPTLTDSEGRFRLGGVDSKECRTVYARRGASVGSGEINPGTPLKIALRRPTHVTGVVSANGNPAKFEAVWARPRDSVAATSSAFPDATTDDQGRYELDLLPGEFSFTAGGVDMGTTALIEGPSQRVDFGEYVGRCSVLFVAGKANAVELVPLQGGNSLTFHDPSIEGRRPVPCGDYRVLIFGKEPSEGMTVHITADATIVVPSLPGDVQ